MIAAIAYTVAVAAFLSICLFADSLFGTSAAGN